MTPKHSEASKHLESGLFHNLKHFSELEIRISNIPESQERGNAFEVFAEALLNIQKVHQAKEVWPQSTCPESIRQKLALPYKDKGIDGIIETTDGKYVAYQVKFRTGRTSLTWEDLSTFVGLATRCDQLLLVANSYKAPAEYDNQPNVHSMRGTDLDHLTAEDFYAIEAWLKTGQVRVKKKKPDPHQITALDDISNGLKEHDRITALMACGTGKTLVTLWAAENSKAKRILVLLPSLALVRQTLLEWAGEASWADFTFLCVCSDPTVSKGAETPRLKSSELPFNVSGNSDEVRQFLEQDNNSVKLVFSTYQSASVVAEGMKGLPPFELGIFDEAHKTAQKNGGSFSFALKDENLPINKRIFCTATPRLHNVMNRNKAGDAALVYSMDNEFVYGPTVHNLSFAKAAKLGIICNYKVLVSAVTTDMVNDYLLSHGGVLIEGDEIRARQVANQLAMSEAVKKYGIQKIFSFHRSIKSACSYTSDESNEGIKTHLPHFECYHVHGKQPTVERDNILHEFEHCDQGIVSNAKCLTEGVDVPAVDMVAFMSPKKSTVDIIQATGRAMRKPRSNSDKEVGYVFLPLYVELHQGEKVEEAIQRTGFAELWNVLSTLQDQDESLSDFIQFMREDFGKNKGFDDSLFREKVEILGPTVSLETLTESITLECIKKLGSLWDERYGELCGYKKIHGDCIVPKTFSENKPLASWVATQRKDNNKGLLTQHKKKRLDSIAFEWDVYDIAWQKMFAELIEFIAKCGHSNVPNRYPANKSLGRWVDVQRCQKMDGVLSGERIASLDTIDFDWDPRTTIWEQRLSELKVYQNEHGHSNVPAKFTSNLPLARWVSAQRNLNGQGRLSLERVNGLEDMGFDWNTRVTKWEEMFKILKAYRITHGHCDILANNSEDIQLVKWVSSIRVANKKGYVTEENITRLNRLGFKW